MIRSYTDDPVDPAVVDRAVANATRAPNAGFTQGWAFLVLDRPADVGRFWSASSDDVDHPDPWLAGMMRAPVVVLPCSSQAAYLERYAEPDKGGTPRTAPANDHASRWAMPVWHLDTAMASLLILQTVTDAGLGACFFSIVPGRGDRVREAFAIPGTHEPIGAITIGHPARGGPPGSPARRARVPWQSVLHRGRWGHPSTQPPP